MSLIDNIAYRYRRWHYHEKPLPKIKISSGAMIPGWTVRIVASVLAALCPFLAAAHTFWAPLFVALVALVTGLAMLFRPGYHVTLPAIVVAALFLLFSARAPFDPNTPWIALSGYLSLRLSLSAALIPPSGKAQIKTLLTWRDLVVTALTLLAGAATLLP